MHDCLFIGAHTGILAVPYGQALVRAQGEHANRIWNLIYSQSCFTNITDKCTERRIFHRLISGAVVPLP